MIDDAKSLGYLSENIFADQHEWYAKTFKGRWNNAWLPGSGSRYAFAIAEEDPLDPQIQFNKGKRDRAMKRSEDKKFFENLGSYCGKWSTPTEIMLI